jgi:gliding motility-associated protein GldM
MSIPKEPRQLMINLMYLVLTAMLALNVSAEVINAFFKIDKGLKKTNEIVTKANEGVLESMEKAVEKRPDDKPLVQFAKDAQAITADFYKYVGDLKAEFEGLAGGVFYPIGGKPEGMKGAETDDVSKHGKPVKYKDKDIPQRFFVDGNEAPVGDEPVYEPNGPKLKAEVLATKKKLEDLLKKAASSTIITEKEVTDLISKLSLSIDEDGPASADKTWSDYNFGHMPVAAIYPMITKFQSDAKNSEASVINFLASKIGGTVLEFDQFQPVAAAEKGYVISGDPFKADIFLSASSKQASYSVRVNGSSLSVKDGVAKYSTGTSSTGEKTYKVDISLKNPFTGKSDNFSKSFKYEVGRRSVTVSADKMNVFYVGVTNPISVAAAGVSTNALKVSCSGGGCNMTKSSNGKYNIKVSQPGATATITVSGGGLQATRFEYRVKRIPDPVAIVGGGPTKRGGAMPAGTFRGQKGVAAILENFDFEARCNLQSFELTRQAKRADAVTEKQNGGTYRGRVATLVGMAKAGDTFYIDNIKARCPGDNAGRNIGSLVFKIK